MLPVGPGRPVQCQRLEQRDRRADPVRAEHGEGGGDGPLRSDPERGGGEQLGEVDPEGQVPGRDVAVLQVDQVDPGPSLGVGDDQHGGRDQRAVGDPPGVQQGQLLPDVGEQLVRQLLVGEQVQGPAAERLVDGDRGVRAEVGGDDQPPGAHPGRLRGVAEQGLLLQRAAR